MKFPDFLYVTLQAQLKEDRPLGFLHAFHPRTAAFLKKKKTQDDWAYEYIHGGYLGEVYEKDSQIWVKTRHWNLDGTKTDIDKPVPEKYQPVILENVPLNGFIILKSVNRYSTSNKVWRILDPRGIEFEISTKCLEDIILNTVIVDGLIKDKCIWVENKELRVFKYEKGA